ncbi:MAG: NUDIX hydrolase [Eubacteriaceae bacterium]|jgi:ADP-ribose pyrophosphatase YjhB (NUDIX family)|nr:NUDIX hydrolase [Eubacteriaceae bacterium]
MEKLWLKWAKRIQAIAQSGMTYTENPFDVERYEELREISVDILEKHCDLDHEEITGLFASEKGYQTPKVDVRAAIIHGDEIMLVKETVDNKWCMPGGWADIGYSIVENVAKEAREEAGAIVTPYKLVGVFDWIKVTNIQTPFAIYKICMLCRYEGGVFKENIETADARFFKRDNLPELSHYRSNRWLIEQSFISSETKHYNALFD